MLVSSSALVSEPRRVCGRNELIVIQARPISSFLVLVQQQNLAKYHIALQFNRAALVSPVQVSPTFKDSSSLFHVMICPGEVPSTWWIGFLGCYCVQKLCFDLIFTCPHYPVYIYSYMVV